MVINMAIVYKITNVLTNKSYIGYTAKTLTERVTDHFKDADKMRDNRKFYNAIRKYRNQTCWIFEVLHENISVNQAKKLEIENIKKFDTYNTGYNATKGGDGNNGIVMSKESNHKRSVALKGVPKDYDRMKGKKHTNESKNKISLSHQGMKKPWVKWSKEQIKKRAMTRRTITKEQYDLIHELIKAELSVKQISQKVGLSYDMTKKWSKKKWSL
jgi:group I intron endonuclease